MLHILNLGCSFITLRERVIINDLNVILNVGCSFITLREPCNNQRPGCYIAWRHVTNHLCNGVPS